MRTKISHYLIYSHYRDDFNQNYPKKGHIITPSRNNYENITMYFQPIKPPISRAINYRAKLYSSCNFE